MHLDELPSLIIEPERPDRIFLVSPPQSTKKSPGSPISSQREETPLYLKKYFDINGTLDDDIMRKKRFKVRLARSTDYRIQTRVEKYHRHHPLKQSSKYIGKMQTYMFIKPKSMESQSHVDVITR
jgi:hypothetical protein